MIYKVFTEEETNTIINKLTYNKIFTDGKHSQQLSKIYNVKENKESTIPEELNKHIGKLLKNKRAIKTIYAPLKIKTRIYNSYSNNNFYDYHVDSFQSSDSKMLYNYGFTIGLSNEYEGGEFVLQTEAGEIGYKINKGEVVIFPIIYPHKVTPVTNGCRQNLIGWFESKVTYEQSYILKAVQEIASTSTNLLKTDSDNNVLKNLLVKSGLVQNYLVTKWGY